MKLNFIQDIASPHNNVIAKALYQDSAIDLDLWYCNTTPEIYGWKTDLTNEVKPAKLYKKNSVDLTFLKHCLTKQDEKYLVVGWQNINTKILLILFTLLRRDFAVWFDLPNDKTERSFIKKIFREFFYLVLKISKAHVFGVGNVTVEYFIKRGFKKQRLTNLPIFVEIDKKPQTYQSQKNEIYSTYNIHKDDFLISTGSRLVPEKGFDILIQAINQLPNNLKSKIKCVIVGKGAEQEILQTQIDTLNLHKQIKIVPWMEIDDLRSLFSVSHMAIHPARFDAYGGATLNAMAAGVAVIASYQCGSGPDRIIHGENGYLYNAEDVDDLTSIIQHCINNKALCKELSKKAYETALKWKPEIGVEIIKGAIK